MVSRAFSNFNFRIEQLMVYTCARVFFIFVTEVYCGPVPQIDNGFSTGASNVTFRGVARYQCYAGFGFPSGQKTEKISCLADGRWEKLPSCQGEYMTFPQSFCLSFVSYL